MAAVTVPSVRTLEMMTGCTLQYIERGRHGRVYRCVGSAVPFAAKIFDTKIQSALAEVKAYRRVGAHPHILRYLGSAIAKDRACITLELAHGCLIDILLDVAYADPARRARVAPVVMRHIGDATAHMHRRGIAHRDIKPDNVLYIEDAAAGMRFVLADMGGATTESLDPHHLRDAQGTQEFAAPEIMELNECYDGYLADSWSFGVLLFCVARGTFLFHVAHLSDTRFAEAAAKADENSGVLAAMLCSETLVPAALHEAADKLLRLSPSKRGVLADMFPVQ